MIEQLVGCYTEIIAIDVVYIMTHHAPADCLQNDRWSEGLLCLPGRLGPSGLWLFWFLSRGPNIDIDRLLTNQVTEYGRKLC